MSTKNNINKIRNQITMARERPSILKAIDEIRINKKIRELIKKECYECKILVSNIIDNNNKNYQYSDLEEIKKSISKSEFVKNEKIIIYCDVDFIGCCLFFEYKNIKAIYYFKTKDKGFKLSEVKFK